MTNTITYYSQNSTNPNEVWSAYAIMPNGQRWGVVAFGDTEKQAVDKIVALYQQERGKVKAVNPWAEMAKPLVDTIPKQYDTQQHHLAGRVWLINISTREKVRVDPDKADAMIATGEWQRGGPRSK